MGKKQLCFQLSKEIDDKINELTKLTGLSTSAVVNLYINGFRIAKYEDTIYKIFVLDDDKSKWIETKKIIE